MSKLKSLQIQQERNYPVEVVSAEFAASAGVNEAAMAIAKRVFLLIFTILLREKTNIGVTIENALLQHLGFSLGVLPKG